MTLGDPDGTCGDSEVLFLGLGLLLGGAADWVVVFGQPGLPGHVRMMMVGVFMLVVLLLEVVLAPCTTVGDADGGLGMF